MTNNNVTNIENDEDEVECFKKYFEHVVSKGFTRAEALEVMKVMQMTEQTSEMVEFRDNLNNINHNLKVLADKGDI